jgi:hypothetical protein
MTDPDDDDVVLSPPGSLERELELEDRIRGLRAQLAERRPAERLTPSESLRAEQELALMRSSATWKIGRIVTGPLRRLRRS